MFLWKIISIFTFYLYIPISSYAVICIIRIPPLYFVTLLHTFISHFFYLYAHSWIHVNVTLVHSKKYCIIQRISASKRCNLFSSYKSNTLLMYRHSWNLTMHHSFWNNFIVLLRTIIEWKQRFFVNNGLVTENAGTFFVVFNKSFSNIYFFYLLPL